MKGKPNPPRRKKVVKRRDKTNRQEIFISEYLKCWNAAEAARRAGYSVKTAREIGYENLTKPDIQAEIKARLDAAHMSADEALVLLAAQARGDVAELMDITSMGFSLDMAKAKAQGLTRLIKKVKQKTTTYSARGESGEDREVNDLEIELYDAQAALDKILHIHGKFIDKYDVNLGGEIRIDQYKSLMEEIYGPPAATKPEGS